MYTARATTRPRIEFWYSLRQAQPVRRKPSSRPEPSALKEGDKIQLQGKVEQFNVKSESETISPRADTETINEAAASMPVLVTQPGGLIASK